MGSYYGNFVIPPMLAQPDDLAAWMGDTPAPANATVLLREASRMVLEATSTAYYDTDTNGLATDTVTATALQQATCIQAAAWNAIGYDPLTGGVQVTAVKVAKGIGSARIQYADAAMAAQARSDAINGLVPAAVQVLELNNLLTPRVWTYG
jgi:hypothetical protein